jgi:hypothetical protein
MAETNQTDLPNLNKTRVMVRGNLSPPVSLLLPLFTSVRI